MNSNVPQPLHIATTNTINSGRANTTSNGKMWFVFTSVCLASAYVLRVKANQTL